MTAAMQWTAPPTRAVLGTVTHTSSPASRTLRWCGSSTMMRSTSRWWWSVRSKAKKVLPWLSCRSCHFNAQKLGDILSSGTTLKTLFQNDIYYNKTALVPPDLNAFCSPNRDESHYYLPCRGETPSCAMRSSHHRSSRRRLSCNREVTKRFIETSSLGKEWIYNILDHKKEVDRIVFEDPDPDTGFILLPDLKWTGEQMEDLYLQAIVRRRDITCLRELDASHLPLLKNLLEKGSAAIKEKYGIPATKLRVYLHYQPSFYHLHVHFSALSFEAPGTWAGKAHLLSSVISNIETCSDHYQKVTLPYTLKDNAPLSAMFKAHGYFSE
ncbi:LOW QUALITY PROTEIN: m7GpppX diphosphatase-like [Scylla paramamosain]|uniref:LOW QUALITY PROTEIN: m7GpppX diphosphatase-like n=1 Tax=Scylla paramamosain TaxID=85552 RepID=UPI00308310BC